MSDIWNISLQDLSRFGEISEHWSPDYAFCIMHVRLCICQRESDESTKEKSCTMYVPTLKSASIKLQKAKKWMVHCATNKQAVECCAVCIVRIAMSVVWPPSLEVGSSHLWGGLIAHHLPTTARESSARICHNPSKALIAPPLKEREPCFNP